MLCSIDEKMIRHSTFVLSAADEESRQTVLSLWTNTMLIKCHQLRILSSARSLQQAIIKLGLETFKPSFELKIQAGSFSIPVCDQLSVLLV